MAGLVVLLGLIGSAVHILNTHKYILSHVLHNLTKLQLDCKSIQYTEFVPCCSCVFFHHEAVSWRESCFVLFLLFSKSKGNKSHFTFAMREYYSYYFCHNDAHNVFFQIPISFIEQISNV